MAMATLAVTRAGKGSPFRTISEVQARLGDVPPERILTYPAPGTATALDLLDSTITGGRGVELVDGILVEKPMGYEEDSIGFWIGVQLFNFAAVENLGKFGGAQGMVRIRGVLVRTPDLSFTRWDSVPDPNELDQLPGPFLEVAPDLVVEVLSEGNTPREMQIKLGEYAAAGVKLVWYVDPDAKTVTVYPKGKERGKKVLTEADTLDGGKVLPGFALPVKDIFARRAPAKKPKKRKK
jgi:Uma2 family endonuclease